MPAPKSGSLSSWLACTDGIAAQWQDLLLLLARVLFGWDLRHKRLAQAHEHPRICCHDAESRLARLSGIYRALRRVHRWRPTHRC